MGFGVKVGTLMPDSAQYCHGGPWLDYPVTSQERSAAGLRITGPGVSVHGASRYGGKPSGVQVCTGTSSPSPPHPAENIRAGAGTVDTVGEGRADRHGTAHFTSECSTHTAAEH